MTPARISHAFCCPRSAARPHPPPLPGGEGVHCTREPHPLREPPKVASLSLCDTAKVNSLSLCETAKVDSLSLCETAKVDSLSPRERAGVRVARRHNSPNFVARLLSWITVSAAIAALSACAVGPDYQRPGTASPPAFKEAPQADAGWFPAAPADTLDRGPWWRLFGDEDLNALVEQVEVSNQNVAAAVAAYAQARALVAQQRATLFPTVGLSGGATRNGGNGAALADGTSGTANRFQIALGASWEPDIWGKLRLSGQGPRASAKASNADLAAARLSAQSEVATNYFSLREAD